MVAWIGYNIPIFLFSPCIEILSINIAIRLCYRVSKIPSIDNAITPCIDILSIHTVHLISSVVTPRCYTLTGVEIRVDPPRYTITLYRCYFLVLRVSNPTDIHGTLGMGCACFIKRACVKYPITHGSGGGASDRSVPRGDTWST